MVLFFAALIELRPEIALRNGPELQSLFQLASSFSSTDSPFFVPYLHLLAAKASCEEGSRWVFARLDSEKSGSSIITRKQFLREIEEHVQRYEPDSYSPQGTGGAYHFGGASAKSR
jgi:hypothetical protein